MDRDPSTADAANLVPNLEADPAATPPSEQRHGPVEEALAVRLAANPDTSPELLRILAGDSRITVRAAVALNPSTPGGADAALAGDADQRVRQLLGHKLAMLIPGLSDGGQTTLGQQTIATLSRLVEDETERVRRAIADIVRDMPQAPRELILRLARDTAIPVSGPVLRLSPVLTSNDLLALLARPPSRSAAAAIAARYALPAEVADAIADSGDNEAIRVLLENKSAHLQEAALDALATRAAGQESWHEPMVRRPKLSGRAATTLSEIVTTHLLSVLADRADLAPDIAIRLKQRLQERTGADGRGRGDTPTEQALQQARSLQAAGRLDEAAIRAAASRGDAKLCAAMLAVAGDLPISVVDRARSLRSAKGVVSLAWHAALSMDTAVTLQVLLGRVAPHAVLRSPDGVEFPLSLDEMRWQIDLLRQMGR